MNYDYSIKINLEEKEKEAINILSQTFNQCMMDDRIDCIVCPFYKPNDTCIPFLCRQLKRENEDNNDN